MHDGQVGQPSPESVSRTAPPVTTMPHVGDDRREREPAQPPVQHRRGGRAPGRPATAGALTPIGTTARRPAARRAAQTRSVTRSRTGGPAPSCSTRCSPSDNAADGRYCSTLASPAGILVQRDRDAAGEQQHQPDQVGRGQRHLGPQGAGDQQPEAAEGGGAEDDQQRRHSGSPCGCQPSAKPEPADQHDLDELEQQHRSGLAARSAPSEAARSRRAA